MRTPNTGLQTIPVVLHRSFCDHGGIFVTHQALSWPRRSCERAPCQPCWWADSSWWAHCTVGCVSVASTEWEAPPSAAALRLAPEACRPRPIPCLCSRSRSSHPVEELLSRQDCSGLRCNLARAPSVHCVFCCASWYDHHAPYGNLRRDMASDRFFNIQP